MSKLSPADRALLSAMADYPLKPGQMLLLGPKAVAVLTGVEQFKGRFVDKHVYEASEWSSHASNAD